MKIHVEWCDKTGKTTLIKALSKELDMEVVKFSQPKTDNVFNEYVEFFWTEKEIKKWLVKNDNIICDRSWIWEQIYGPIYRKKKMKKHEVKKLDLASLANWDIIIYCDTDKWTIKKKFIEDWEDFTKLKDIGRIQRYYRKTLKTLRTPVITYDWTIWNIESIIYLINILKWFES